ncbi:hypothetical protein FRX31_006829 [Thalictrum thalictroides]|uniref:Uncharacterized protein n=1 Tax=Thalictrum thalictroides TaxID=46969 RepID=A0A7J6X451_THATH|nr:hypothetical protein FRX31_006829 [Thalictrum thalictroides]
MKKYYVKCHRGDEKHQMPQRLTIQVGGRRKTPRCATKKEGAVHEHWTVSGSSAEWNLHLRRDLRSWEMESKEQLLIILARQNFTDCHDTWRWNGSIHGHFIFESMYRRLEALRTDRGTPAGKQPHYSPTGLFGKVYSF